MRVVCIGKKLFIHETDGMSGHSGVDLITLMIESVSGNVGLTVEPTGKYYEIPYTDFFDKDNLPLGVSLVDVVTKLKDARDTALEDCT